ncbi:hypothetical protein ACWDYH_36375 [Nocardia goodfellowii]
MDATTWELSCALFDRFMDNVPEIGGPNVYDLLPKDVASILEMNEVREAVRKAVDDVVVIAKRLVESNPAFLGIEHEISSNWYQVMNPDQDSDLRWALGTFSVGVGCDIALKESDGKLWKSGSFRWYVYDFYDHKRDSFAVSRTMRDAEEAGIGRGFRVHGNYDNSALVYRLEGQV